MSAVTKPSARSTKERRYVPAWPELPRAPTTTNGGSSARSGPRSPRTASSGEAARDRVGRFQCLAAHQAHRRLLRPWIELILQPITQQVESQRREQDRDARKNRRPRGEGEKIAALGEHAPSEAVGGCVPRPRNDSAASTSIAVESDRLVCTSMIGERFGSRWRARMRASVAPSERAALTYSVSFNNSAGARSVRAKIGV